MWSATIEEHRHDVRTAVFTATTVLLQREGLRGLTMSGIAEEAGIGRATLYKYFADVDAILGEWHSEQVAAHLAELHELAAGDGPASERLERVLLTFMQMLHRTSRHAGISELAASLHEGARMHGPESALHALLASLLRDAANEQYVRRDVPTTELAAYCMQAMSAARHAKNDAARARRRQLVVAGLRPQG